MNVIKNMFGGWVYQTKPELEKNSKDMTSTTSNSNSNTNSRTTSNTSSRTRSRTTNSFATSSNRKKRNKRAKGKSISIHKIKKRNKTMKSIRKLQNECDLLHKCFQNDMLKLNYVYDGYFFNKTCYNNIFQYTVYLPELKLTSYLKTTEEFAEYEKKQIKLFLFNNKDKFKQKIRLALV